MKVTIETEYAKINFQGSVDEIVDALKKMGIDFSKLQRVKVKMERAEYKDKAGTS